MPRLSKIVLVVAALVVIAIPATHAAADDDMALAHLAEQGTHALMRHALAPGTGDPANFALRDCATQRNLDAAGRKQAEAIGGALRKAGIRIDRVLSSQWCRCLETARLLALGPVTEEPAINSFFADTSTRDVQTEATRRLLVDLPPDETAILVTHQVNITALTGVFPRSGEVIVVKTVGYGSLEVLGRFLLSD